MKHFVDRPLFAAIVIGQRHPPGLGQRRFVLVWRWLVAVGLVIWFGMSAWARDPVPAELEKATPEAKQKYMEAAEQKDRESYARKLREGQRRYDERMEFKKGIVADLNRDVVKQQEQQMASASVSLPDKVLDSPVSRLVKNSALLLLLAVAGYGFLLWRYFFRRTSG